MTPEFARRRIEQLDEQEGRARDIARALKSGAKVAAGFAFTSFAVGGIRRFERASTVAALAGVLGSAALNVSGEVFDRVADASSERRDKISDKLRAKKLMTVPVK